jgi:hypothetical protein
MALSIAESDKNSTSQRNRQVHGTRMIPKEKAPTY